MVRYRPTLVALDRGIHDGSMDLFPEIGISTRVQRSGSIQLHERHWSSKIINYAIQGLASFPAR
jgi:hypothetical protein